MAHCHQHQHNEETPLVVGSNQQDEEEEEEGRIPLDDGTIPGVDHVVVSHKNVENGLGASKAQPPQPSPRLTLSRLIRIIGPGIMVCLADTDGPCLLTAAQSGAKYRYSLVFCQIVLIPILYAAQELTARLAVCTKQGTTALIRQHYGAPWAWFAVTLHVSMCWIGQASEFGSMAQLYHDAFGIDRKVTNTVQFLFMSSIIGLGRCGFRMTEIVGMAVGSLQLVFVALLWVSQAKPTEVFRGLGEFHLGQSSYEVLLAGNIGAVIMPWMLYYQQSAVCERRITRRDLPYERADTLIGAVLAQLVMMAMVVAMGSLRYYGPTDDRSELGFGDIIRAYAQAISGTRWSDVQEGATSILDVQPSTDDEALLLHYGLEIDTWYTPASYQVAKWVTVLGVSGACTVASMVLTITSVWSVTEILDLERDLFRPFKERPLQYYLQYGGLLIAYTVSIWTDVSGSWFAVLTQTINGLLILPVAVFLWLLASSPKVLPKEYRLAGWYKWSLAILFGIICAYCIYGMVQEIVHPV